MKIDTIEELEDQLSDPPQYVIEALRECPGRTVVLGASGKMGPTLTRMIYRARQALGRSDEKVWAVSRFSHPEERTRLQAWGIQTIQGDLLDEGFLSSLPDAENVFYLAGMKFGATGNESLTWAMNAYLPSIVCKRYATSRIAAFSTGNVYGLCPIVRGGNVETDLPAPVGEYAMSCLGRERIFEHHSRTPGGPAVILLRLNYACELRYGVIVDLAMRLKHQQPIDLSMGVFNAIWQADANAMAIASLRLAMRPATIMNLAGPEVLSVRRVSQKLADLMGVKVEYIHAESSDAILSNAQQSHRLFGYPRVGAEEMIHRIAAWVDSGGPVLNKPTHFETRDGKY